MKERIGAIGALIIVNVIFFAFTLMPDLEGTMFGLLALYFPLHPNFGVWQFLTNMFMHGGLAHLLFNMYALWAFGSPLLKMWGSNRFLLFYFAAGLGASLIYTLVNYVEFTSLLDKVLATGITDGEVQALLSKSHTEIVQIAGQLDQRLLKLYQLYSVPAVGASGAIYGVLVAFGISFPNAKLALIFLPVPIAAKYFIPILIALDLFSGVTGFSIFGGGIAHFAHIGGALIGFLLMWLWRNR